MHSKKTQQVVVFKCLMTDRWNIEGLIFIIGDIYELHNLQPRKKLIHEIDYKKDWITASNIGHET
jgi:hypothetical protein